MDLRLSSPTSPVGQVVTENVGEGEGPGPLGGRTTQAERPEAGGAKAASGGAAVNFNDSIKFNAVGFAQIEQVRGIEDIEKSGSHGFAGGQGRRSGLTRTTPVPLSNAVT